MAGLFTKLNELAIFILCKILPMYKNHIYNFKFLLLQNHPELFNTQAIEQSNSFSKILVFA